MYYYKSSIGILRILPNPDSPDRFQLWINDNYIGSYHTSQAAADDVYRCHTHYRKWDKATNIKRPRDITEWFKEKSDF